MNKLRYFHSPCNKSFFKNLVTYIAPSELSEQPESQVPYCPVENRFRLKRSAGSYPSKGASCERVSVEVKNSSGVRMEVFWVDSEGREVREGSRRRILQLQTRCHFRLCTYNSTLSRRGRVGSGEVCFCATLLKLFIPRKRRRVNWVYVKIHDLNVPCRRASRRGIP